MALLTVIATLLCLAGTGCGVVSLATTSWITPGVGLFQECVTFIVQKCTITIGDDAITLIVACLLMVGLFLCIPAIIMLFMDILKTNKKTVLVSGTMLLVAGLLIAGGATTYTIVKKPSGIISLTHGFGYSFYMAWASCAGIMLAGIFAFISSGRSH